MRTPFIILALMLTVAIITAQEAKKQMKVRVKKIETVNGVEKITDTTYVTDDLSTLPIDAKEERLAQLHSGDQRDFMIVRPNEAGEEVIIRKGKPGGECTIKGDYVKREVHRFIIDDTKAKDGERTMVVNVGREMTPEEHKAFMEAAKKIREIKDIPDMDVLLRDAESLSRLKEIEDPAPIKDPAKIKKIERIIIIREIKTEPLTESDKTMLNKTTGINDEKLSIDEMRFYPNPNDGKFNLTFSLKEKGDTKVQVLNNEGKMVYNELLVDFTGSYTREMDISKYPKGIYFVRVEQNAHAQVKKIVLE